MSPEVGGINSLKRESARSVKYFTVNLESGVDLDMKKFIDLAGKVAGFDHDKNYLKFIVSGGLMYLFNGDSYAHSSLATWLALPQGSFNTAGYIRMSGESSQDRKVYIGAESLEVKGLLDEAKSREYAETVLKDCIGTDFTIV